MKFERPLVPRSRVGQLADAAARRAATETILEARAEGRSLVIDVDGTPQFVPAVEIPTPDERDAAVAAATANGAAANGQPSHDATANGTPLDDASPGQTDSKAATDGPPAADDTAADATTPRDAVAAERESSR